MKIKISRAIVEYVRTKKGRFLEFDVDHGLWNDVGDKKAREKTSQLLRDGAALLRRQLAANEGENRLKSNNTRNAIKGDLSAKIPKPKLRKSITNDEKIAKIAGMVRSNVSNTLPVANRMQPLFTPRTVIRQSALDMPILYPKMIPTDRVMQPLTASSPVMTRHTIMSTPIPRLQEQRTITTAPNAFVAPPVRNWRPNDIIIQYLIDKVLNQR